MVISWPHVMAYAVSRRRPKEALLRCVLVDSGVNGVKRAGSTFACLGRDRCGRVPRSVDSPCPPRANGDEGGNQRANDRAVMCPRQRGGTQFLPPAKNPYSPMQTINTVATAGGFSRAILPVPESPVQDGGTAVPRQCRNYRGPTCQGTTKHSCVGVGCAALPLHVSGHWRRKGKKGRWLPGPELGAIFLRRPSPGKPSESIRVRSKLCHTYTPKPTHHQSDADMS